MGCPYVDDPLFGEVANPFSSYCNDCEDYDCIHNPNPDPREDWFGDPMVEIYERDLHPIHDGNAEPPEGEEGGA